MIPICDRCGANMDTATSCIEPPYPGGLEPVRYGDEQRFGPEWRRLAAAERCHDCGVALFGTHHVGCDVAECALCHQQLFLGCDCSPAVVGTC